MAAKSEPPTSASMATDICNQISSVFSTTDPSHPPALDVLVSEITKTASQHGRIFVHGVGREGLMLKALCMRLAHLGLPSHCVADVTAPPITPTDLLLASTGPGGFPTVDAICTVARSAGARVVVITARPGGSASREATAVAYLAGRTMAEGEGGGLLPMGSLYEGAMFVLFEMVVWRLAKELGQSEEEIRSRHTNLE
ncbi:hypothetical protein QJS10_CPB11g00711 [Acorus calamus]|uniref:SIS domain-containing protein n=1 Tax=Acorus calamus TaxID=4465 RepID=A0AAV9DRJ5_ACOCL|nr:hypothetical protein QJS10_CPB11g00711 [Acorus calamus]